MLVLLGILVAAAVLASLYLWRRTGKPTALLLTVGGLVCSLNEPLVDVLGNCWFPTDGVMAQEIFDRAIPVWVVLAYVIFFGFFAYTQAALLRSGVTRRQVWMGIAAFWVLNTALEMPLLASDLYVYYGDQPFEIGGFPLSWLVINSLGSFAAAVIAVRLDWFFRGARRLLLAFVPFAAYMASWVLAMPYFGTQNADVSSPVRWIGAAVAMALGVVALDALIRIGLVKPAAAPAVPANGSPTGPVRPLARV